MPHIHEKIDFTVGAVIVHKRKVLLRFHDKHEKWLLPGGHVEPHEDPNEAVVREAAEEVGLKICLMGGGWRARESDGNGGLRFSDGELIAPRFLNRHPIGENGHEHVDHVYLATSDSDAVVPSGDDRSDKWKWFSGAELNDPQYALEPRIKYYALTALSEITNP